jgi:hypothetical protein
LRTSGFPSIRLFSSSPSRQVAGTDQDYARLQPEATPPRREHL